MSALNQLFNRGLLGPKCKTSLNLAISRIKLLQNKRQVQLNHMRKEISQFLQTGQEAIARIRVEHLVREMNMLAAYDILELFCEFVYARVPILETQKECPKELQEAITSIIFAAPRCSDLPELLQVRNLFTAKYGKEFTSAADELRPDTSVNRSIIEKLSVKAPSGEEKLGLLKEIALEYHLEWDASRTKAEFGKKHEDLLDGSNKISREATNSQVPAARNLPTPSSGKMRPPVSPKVKNQRIEDRTATVMAIRDMSLVSPDHRTLPHSEPSNLNLIKPKSSSQSNDVMEMARAAISAAERASATARRAAELVNSKNGSWVPRNNSLC
ncbi:hypothetical protein Sjap_024460 [Stephania japonica]|uniref:IST1-like protein n=1 Tax=Stephania japonica TaxID=461633 RepID=A0AAP0EKM8_9MAGN